LVTVTSRHIASDSLFTFILQHVCICLQRYLTTLSNYMASLYCPQATRWSLILVHKTSWWRSSCYYPCRTHRHSAFSHHRLLETLFSACIVAKLSAARTNSSPVVPALQSSVPRTAPDTFIMSPSPPKIRITSWSVVCRWMNMERWWNTKGKLEYWQSNLSQSHLVHHESQMKAWNQNRTSAVRGRWLAA